MLRDRGIPPGRAKGNHSEPGWSTSWRAFHRSLSVWRLKGSRLVLTVPVKRTGSWGETDIEGEGRGREDNDGERMCERVKTGFMERGVAVCEGRPRTKDSLHSESAIQGLKHTVLQ